VASNTPTTSAASSSSAKPKTTANDPARPHFNLVRAHSPRRLHCLASQKSESLVMKARSLKQRSRDLGESVPQATEHGWLCATGALAEFPTLPLAVGLRGLSSILRHDNLLLRRIEILAGGSIVAVAVAAPSAAHSNTALPRRRTTPPPSRSARPTAALEVRIPLWCRAAEATIWLAASRAEILPTSSAKLSNSPQRRK
jgi:hypothetical protein